VRAAAGRAVSGLIWCACDEGQDFLSQGCPVLAGCCVYQNWPCVILGMAWIHNRHDGRC